MYLSLECWGSLSERNPSYTDKNNGVLSKVLEMQKKKKRSQLIGGTRDNIPLQMNYYCLSWFAVCFW